MSQSQYLSNTQEQEFSYGQLFGILLRRWPLLLGAFGLSMGVAAYQASQLKPVYYSSMELIVEPNFQQQLSASDLLPYDEQSISEVDYATQLNLMRSAQFIEVAIERLQADYPGITPAEANARFQLNRVYEGEKTATRIFKASYTGVRPEFPQRFLEELRNVYLEYDEERQQQRLNRGLDNINQQLYSTKRSLTGSQDSLQEFRQDANLIDPATQAQAAAESLRDVQSSQRQVASRISDLEAQIQEIGDRIGLSFSEALVAARLSQSDQLQSLKQALQTTELELAERRNIFTAEDPTVKLLLDRRQNQRQILRETIAEITGRSVNRSNAELESYLELGPVDISLASELLGLQNTLQGLLSLEQELQRQEDQLGSELQQYPQLIAEYDRLQPEVETERETLDRLLQEREQITSELTKGGYNWQVVEPPSPSIPIASDPKKILLIGAVAGLFVGGLLIFAREAMDNVVRTSDDLKKQMPLPLIGILPLLAPKRGFRFIPGQHEKATAVPLHPEIAESPLIQTILNPVFRESLDVIANLLQLKRSKDDCRVLAVTSAKPGEGKTTVALGLAYSLVRMNQRVLVIDADLRLSGLRAQLNMDNQKSLAAFLDDGLEPKLQHLHLGSAEISILPAGLPPADPLLLLSSPRLKLLLDKVRDFYDVVLVDTPPVLGIADAIKIGSGCDGLLLVTRLDRVTQSDLTKVLSLLSPLNVIGTVANGCKGTSAGYETYGGRIFSSQSVSTNGQYAITRRE